MYYYKTYRKGVLLGTKYLFPKRGDGLPMHGHMEENKHNIIVLQGSCEIYGPEKKWSQTLKQGSIFHFEEDQYPHEVAALEDETIILNLLIWGDKFIHCIRNLGNPDDSGTVEDPLTIPVPELKISKKRKK